MISKINTPYGKVAIYRKTAPGASKTIMVVPGFSESLTHNRELVDILANRGYDALTFRQPRRKAGSTNTVLNRNKTIALAVLKGTIPEGAKVYGVAHSLGSVALLRAASEAPSQFAQIVLMQPPGVTSSQSFPELVRRVTRKTIRNNTSTIRDRHLYKLKGKTSNRPRSITTRAMLKSQLSSGYVIAKNPRLALNEALAAIKYDIADDIAKLKQLNIPVNVIKAASDELFSPANIAPSDNLNGAYFSLVDKEAPHDTFWMHPERMGEMVDFFVKNNQ